jgi:DNA-binding response OmpR family regulator
MSKPKILIVDDNKYICQLLQSRLNANGYQAVFANSGSEALKMAWSDVPDLILLDITMPEQDGFEVGKKLRENIATKFTPILMVTAQAQHSSIVRALADLSASGYIVKPFNPEELLKEVRAALGEKEPPKKIAGK